MKTVCEKYLNGMDRFVTVITTLMVGMAFALTTSVASAAVVKHVNIDNNKDVIEAAVVKAPVASKVEVQKVEKAEVKADSSSGVAVPRVNSSFIRPFGFGFGFNPFFDEEFFGFEE